jgi:prevent-host-death family protein
MVMKNAAAKAQGPRKKPQRVSVADAKARLSSLIRDAERRPTVIQNRGRDVAVLISIADYERVSAIVSAPPETNAARFLREVDALKERFGGGVDDFEPERLDLRAQTVQL